MPLYCRIVNTGSTFAPLQIIHPEPLITNSGNLSLDFGDLSYLFSNNRFSLSLTLVG